MTVPTKMPANTSSAKCWLRYIRLYPPNAAKKNKPTCPIILKTLEFLIILVPLVLLVILVLLVTRTHSTNVRAKKLVVCPDGKEYHRFIRTPSANGSCTSGMFWANHVTGRGALMSFLNSCVVSADRIIADDAKTPSPMRLKSNNATHTTYGNHSATCV